MENWNPGIDVTQLAQMLTVDVKTFALILAIVSVWEIIWKGIGLWKAGRSSQPWWFIAILVLNSAGIIPIIYLLFFQPEHDSTDSSEASVRSGT